MPAETTETVVETKPDTLTQVIEKSLPVVDDKVVEKPEEKKPEEKKEETNPADDMTADQIVIAKQLLRGLQNPDERKTIIEFLVKQSGLELAQPTKQEIKEVKKDLVSVLKAALGPELDYLADKMGPAIEQIIDAKLNDGTKDLRSTLETQLHERLQGEAAGTMSSIAQSFFKADEIPDDVLGEMTKLMDRRPPTAGTAMKDYVEDIFYSVVGRKGLTPVNKKKEERINNNRTDAPSRLASEGRREPVPGSDAPKFKSLDEAVKAAAATVAEREK